MFARPIRVKSNTAIKGSDRRKLKADLSTAFPSLSADELSELVPNKEELNVVKIYAHKGDAVTLYVLHKNPLFFELEKRLYPTVYVLWRYPALLPTFMTWPPVLQKMVGGADLMLPGVVVPSSGLPIAPVAVGTAAVSTGEMHSLGMKGEEECVFCTRTWIISECDGQEEYEEEYEVNEMEMEEEEVVEKCVEEEQCPGETVTDQACSGVDALSLAEQEEEKGEKGNEEEDGNQDDQKMPQEQGEEVRAPPADQYISPEPHVRLLLSKFLQAMQKQHNLVRMKELTKGVESIVEVDWKNRQLRSFQVPKETEGEVAPVQDEGEGESPYHPPEITTMYSVSSRLEPLFLDVQKRKGTILQPAEVKHLVTEYVKKMNWWMKIIRKIRVPGDRLPKDVGKQECYQIVYPGQRPIQKKGHIEPIDIAVASRGSNKKVTLIKNLEVYGLDPAVVATALQRRVQASSVLQPIPGSKDKVLVQIQGNQIHQAGNLLLDHYQIPRKYINGLEKAPKGGKKK
ncbi:hypothetical protein F7725_000871 [Dissostichus mawsoni]|uniref:Eukaryotic translation initiation factor 2D n=1 Tax=Dissostichus mawsoni TaxID=36200 RepID=A0A7J5ZG49_DISMA|nr:hypothetical protein F7725_000871 [Dissostichus mawsoni]